VNKNIIIAGIAAIGLYLFSHQKKTVHKAPDIPPIKKMAEKMAAERLPPDASSMAKKELAEKIYADIMARRAAALKKIAKKIPEASTPAARRKIAEKKAAAAAEKAAEKAAFTPEIKLAIATLSVSEKIQALVAYRKKIAAEKKVSPQSISLTQDTRARVLLEAAIEKAAKKPVPILLDNSKKKNKTPGDIKKKFGSWVQPEPKGQETSHKSTEPGYSKKKTKEEILKLFGLWSLPTISSPKSKPKLRHIVAKKLSRIRPTVRRLISARRSVSKPKWKPHLSPKKRIIAKIRPTVRRLISARRLMSRLRRR